MTRKVDNPFEAMQENVTELRVISHRFRRAATIAAEEAILSREGVEAAHRLTEIQTQENKVDELNRRWFEKTEAEAALLKRLILTADRLREIADEAHEILENAAEISIECEVIRLRLADSSSAADRGARE